MKKLIHKKNILKMKGLVKINKNNQQFENLI